MAGWINVFSPLLRAGQGTRWTRTCFFEVWGQSEQSYRPEEGSGPDDIINKQCFLLEITSTWLFVCETRSKRCCFSLSPGFAFPSGSVSLPSCKTWDVQPPCVSPAAHNWTTSCKTFREAETPRLWINMFFHCLHACSGGYIGKMEIFTPVLSNRKAVVSTPY